MRFVITANVTNDNDCTSYCEYLYCDDKVISCVPKVCAPWLKAI